MVKSNLLMKMYSSLTRTAALVSEAILTFFPSPPLSLTTPPPSSVLFLLFLFDS